jgi:hypothetical protein
MSPCCLGLGHTDKQRQQKYKEFVQGRVHDAEWKSIREAIQKNWAYGYSGFQKVMAGVISRAFELKKTGRKPKREITVRL